MKLLKAETKSNDDSSARYHVFTHRLNTFLNLTRYSATPFEFVEMNRAQLQLNIPSSHYKQFYSDVMYIREKRNRKIATERSALHSSQPDRRYYRKCIENDKSNDVHVKNPSQILAKQ